MKTKKTSIIKKQGTKTLAGILAVGMTFGTPVSVLADDNTPDSTMEQQAGVQNVLAKKVDGSETLVKVSEVVLATVYKGNIIKNLIMDCQSYTKYRPNETTGGIFVSWRRKEELPTGA